MDVEIIFDQCLYSKTIPKSSDRSTQWLTIILFFYYPKDVLMTSHLDIEICCKSLKLNECYPC